MKKIGEEDLTITFHKGYTDIYFRFSLISISKKMEK